MKTFPIMQESRRGENGAMEIVPIVQIPWEAAEIAYKSYGKRHNQSLERIAERGGFGRDEFLYFLELTAKDMREKLNSTQK